MLSRQPNQQPTRMIIIAILLSLLVIGVFSYLSPSNLVATGITSSSQATTVATDTPFWWQYEHLAILKEDLATREIDAATRRAYEEEIRQIEAALTAIANSRTALAATPRTSLADRTVIAPTSTPVATLAPPPTGILENFNTPPVLKGVHVISAWQDWVDGVWVEVYSGNFLDDPQQGVVFALPHGETSSSSNQASGLLLAPVKGGTLRITASQAHILTLVDEQGTTLTFDAQVMRLAAQ